MFYANRTYTMSDSERARRTIAQTHADAAIAYELIADDYGNTGNFQLARAYRELADARYLQIPADLRDSYTDQLFHARYVRPINTWNNPQIEQANPLMSTPVQSIEQAANPANKINRDNAGQTISRPSKLFIDRACNYRLGYSFNVASSNERLVPSLAWIIWDSDDQSDNEITFDGRKKSRANYEFNPLTDKLMRDEYKQEIRNMLFDLDYDTRLSS